MNGRGAAKMLARHAHQLALLARERRGVGAGQRRDGEQRGEQRAAHAKARMAP